MDRETCQTTVHGVTTEQLTHSLLIHYKCHEAIKSNVVDAHILTQKYL